MPTRKPCRMRKTGGVAGQTDVNYAIIRLARAHRNVAATLLGELGLHPGQEVVLGLLAERDRCSAAELAAGACVEPGTMSRTLASLERAGYLTREGSATDRRAVCVRLTDRGREAESRIEAAWRELGTRTLAGLSVEEQQTLGDLLARVSANLSR